MGFQANIQHAERVSTGVARRAGRKATLIICVHARLLSLWAVIFTSHHMTDHFGIVRIAGGSGGAAAHPVYGVHGREPCSSQSVTSGCEGPRVHAGFCMACGQLFGVPEMAVLEKSLDSAKCPLIY